MKTVKVDEWFREYLKTGKRVDETTGEALVRLTGAPGPDPELVAGILSEEGRSHAEKNRRAGHIERRRSATGVGR